MIEELLQASDGKLLIPLTAVVAGIAVVKGIFSLHRSRSQDRRDFLELFTDWESRDDLWLTVAVRHVFGAYLPASLIRQLMAGPQPGRAVLEVASAWDFLDMHDETGDLYWRCRWLGAAWVRSVTGKVSFVLYVALASTSGLCAVGAYVGSWGVSQWVLWLYVLLTLMLALRCLAFSGEIAQADKAARRWLGL